jgi:hypothetical protein
MDNPQARTLYDKILEIVSLIALLCSFYPVLLYSKLSNEVLIPVHYDLNGEVDGWGGRNSLWIMPLIVLGVYIGLSIVEKYPKAINYPCKVTEQNATYIHRMGVQLMRHIKLFSTLLSAYMNNFAYAVAMGKCSGSSNFIIVLLIAGLCLSAVIYFGRMMLYEEVSK